jgi:hypothetical protein
VHRPVDWFKPSTFRIAEIETATVLIINPKQARQAPAGLAVSNLGEEQGVLTAWADKLGAEDGISTYFSAPTAKILTIDDRARFKASLERVVARYSWDNAFVVENNLQGGKGRQ